MRCLWCWVLRSGGPCPFLFAWEASANLPWLPGFSRVRREFSVSAFGRTPKPREKRAFRAGHYKDLTETRNRARKVSGTQGTADFRAFPEERSLIAGHQPAGV